ncbi:hypothetical protein KC367_g2118 [Hortaea werneckii]|nr:hypothetical protein KC342_g14015 [Hortaea werneckii]KAI7074752.1 hypothetical protein KC339_g14037 [Hortaea werneckii]KAI7222751.1 hypothetical protein KC365_g11320 [Hortaea werneckii]KAI7303321.1 hypothetical protein KC340_g12512 [Hortaea werneckii]KAI7305962.1 hypothetical protein KC315_g14436 [Hortaea werneckii]
MAMAVDSRQQAAPFNGMGYDAMRYSAPQFTNPWVSQPQTSSQSHLYATSLPQQDVKHYAAQAPPASSAYPSGHLHPTSLASGMLSLDPDLSGLSGLQFAQDMSAPRPYGASYHQPTTAPSSSSYAPTSAPHYSPSYGYDRRPSHPSVTSSGLMAESLEMQRQRQGSLIDFNDRLSTASEAERQSFSDALDASRGMVAMSQSDITPRNVYGAPTSSRSSLESYGFPSSHSSHSSISSASGYPGYYNSSVSEASIGDYSSASESVDGMSGSRTLPRPSALIGGNMPPAPQSMMGQFNSKVSSSSQKKHKCKICDKRFTRPSSLQTHMYSHTGEKPFACEVEGCGRHFSVVSNLRRHRKVHKGEGHDHPSPDDDE